MADKQLGIDSMLGMPAALNESMHKEAMALMTGGLSDPKRNVALLKPVTVTSMQQVRRFCSFLGALLQPVK